MQYRTDTKSGNELSVLGFGCMRFPRNFSKIDMNKSEKLILTAVQNGVNYYDTAFLYGGSEDTLGQIIQKNNLRDKIFIATKLPIMKCQAYNDFDNLFQAQLDRLHTTYIDYYLMHNVSAFSLWEKLCAMGIEKWIAEKKASGQVRQIGFSFHGIQNEFLKILNGYNWDFCQIQYNYININYQAGMAGLQAASRKGLPVFIMEPLLGGKLATGLPKKAVNLFKTANPAISPVKWALNWLWDQKEVTVVLSGMNEESQLKDNIEAANNAVPNMLTSQEREVFKSVIEVFNASYKIPCTGCNYCLPCPHNVNIPGCFVAYNVSYTMGKIAGMTQYITSTGATDNEKKYLASKCNKCGACEKKCPQHIPIIKSLGNVTKRMETFWLKMFIGILGRSRKNTNKK
jgi:predicted aldo/keto reductase-like oxidoreductase